MTLDDGCHAKVWLLEDRDAPGDAAVLSVG
jgi:hypothetical protein